MRFEWDEEKAAANAVKHGVTFEEAESMFDGPMFIRPDVSARYGEERFVAMGVAGGKAMVLVYTERDDVVRIISLRNRRASSERSVQRDLAMDEGDERIDFSDIPELDDEFFENAVLRLPDGTCVMPVPADAEVSEWFLTRRSDWKPDAAQALREYMERHRGSAA